MEQSWKHREYLRIIVARLLSTLSLVCHSANGAIQQQKSNVWGSLQVNIFDTLTEYRLPGGQWPLQSFCSGQQGINGIMNIDFSSSTYVLYVLSSVLWKLCSCDFELVLSLFQIQYYLKNFWFFLLGFFFFFLPSDQNKGISHSWIAQSVKHPSKAPIRVALWLCFHRILSTSIFYFHLQSQRIQFRADAVDTV